MRGVAGKVRRVGEKVRVTGGGRAVPERDMDCGERTALSVAMRVALRVPRAPVVEGWKAMERLQLAPDASVWLQVLRMMKKSLGLAPEKL